MTDFTHIFLMEAVFLHKQKIEWTLDIRIRIQFRKMIRCIKKAYIRLCKG